MSKSLQVKAENTPSLPSGLVPKDKAESASPSLYVRLRAVMKPEDISNHESDLYVRYTPEAQAIIAEWKREKGLTGWGLCSWFTNQVEGGHWIDIPFAFDPYWEKKLTA